jgi:type VI secretion system protein VasJ
MSPRFSPTLQALADLRADLPIPRARRHAGPTPRCPRHDGPTPSPTRPRPGADPAAPAAPDTPPVSADPPVDPAAPAAWRPALAAWLAPAAVAPPCGPDPSGHDTFDAARQQLARLSAVTGEPVDWPRVDADSDTILRTVARDLRPATWLALARCHRGDVPAFTLAVHLVAALLEDFADELHPRRPKARRDALDWFLKQSALALAAVPLTRLSAPHLGALDAARQHLADALDARLPDPPSLRPLREAILTARQRLPEPTPIVPAPPPPAPPAAAPSSAPLAQPAASHAQPAQPAAAPPAQPASHAQPAAPHAASTAQPAAPSPAISVAAAPPPATPGDLDRFLTATSEALQDAARGLREASPTDPRAYRLLRTGLWLHLTAAPPRRPDGNTNIPGLDDRDRAQLAELAAGARWPALATRCENLLVRHRLAFDLQRLACAALTAMGPDHAAAVAAVLTELRALLGRLPELVDLNDRDGQPLADPATRRWLSGTVLASAARGEPSEDASFWTDLGPRLRGRDRLPALTDAQTHIDAGSSGRQRFTRRLALAETALAADDPPLAHLLFTALADELAQADIDAWDPPLAARCLTAQARCPAPAAPPSPTLLRLARVDIAAAADLLPPTPPR